MGNSSTKPAVRKLCDAAARGHDRAVVRVIKRGVDVNAHEGAALREAAFGGHESTVRTLVKLGADPVGHDARQFAVLLERDLALWRKVALASGIKVE